MPWVRPKKWQKDKKKKKKKVCHSIFLLISQDLCAWPHLGERYKKFSQGMLFLQKDFNLFMRNQIYFYGKNK